MTDRQFWLRCDEAEPVYSADEIKWTLPQQFELLLRHGLLKEAAKATRTACDACGDGHVEEVAWLKNAETGMLVPFIPCPEVGGAPVDPERLRRWAVDLDMIAEGISAALVCTGNSAPVPLIPGRVWALGRRHLAGRFRDFFLVCAARRPDAHLLWDRCPQISEAPSAVVIVPAFSPQQRREPVFRLADVAAITEAGLSLDLDYIADAVPRETYSVPAKSIASFPVPDGATWEELRITVRENSIVAELHGTTREFTADDVGFAGEDDRLWQVLCMFARFEGETPARGRSVPDKSATTFRKHVSDLRKRLTTVFPIAGEPIRAGYGTGSYRCLFQIRLDRRGGFPNPPDRWDECRFTELRDGRISITVKATEVFAARTISDETQRRTGIEAAERLTTRTEDYDLCALGLADQAGLPTSEGRLLLEFLRSGGKLNRRGDDKDLLRLGQRLRAWMEIDGEPFQFIPSRRLWSAVFECGSLKNSSS